MELRAVLNEILFGDVPDKLPDPNKEQNIPRLKAIQLEREQKYRRFFSGVGEPLLDRWKDKLRENTLNLFAVEPDCGCSTCNKIREITTILKMLSEAELIINKE